MENQFVRNLMVEQRRRLLGSIMGYAERSVFPNLSAVEQKAFREKVMAAVNAYHDVCLDALKASVDDGSILVNEEALLLLREIRQEVGRGN